MGFSIDPERMHDSGRKLEQTSHEGEADLAAPRMTITGQRPWGADEGGSAVAEAHAELGAVADEVLTQLFLAISGVGANVKGMADDMQEIDERSRDELNAVARQLGERL
ncbi:hypothetical protein AB8O55_11665 [Saccharopolyspora cebuensis]|uniref:Excreted virulence factor EspC, type VII ESX diderm n=1 Tax=Saccharopolyspora cebuensis TaxID=418759 RepID=A0ABV4CG11_9PSEU